MKRILLLLSLFSYAVLASETDPARCIKDNNDAIKIMTLRMARDLKIDKSVLNPQKTKAEILSVTPVNQKLAIIYGKEEWRLSGGAESEDPTTPEEYARGFMQDNTKNMVVKYTYEDKQGRQNVFIASTFVSDVSCIARFNGYIIVKREF